MLLDRIGMLHEAVSEPAYWRTLQEIFERGELSRHNLGPKNVEYQKVLSAGIAKAVKRLEKSEISHESRCFCLTLFVQGYYNSPLVLL